MTVPYDVKITITSIDNSPCPLGHQVGESWLVDEKGKTPGGICARAYDLMSNDIVMFRFGGHHARTTPEPPDLHYFICHPMNCPDQKGMVTFEIKKLIQKY